MGKQIFAINTARVALNDVIRYVRELDSSIIVHSIIDDSLSTEVITNEAVTPGVLNRLCTYFVLAEQAGADLVLNMCSSVGEAADIAAKMVKIPVVKIDQRMAEEACRIGRRIGIVATVTTTLGPTMRLIQKSADQLGKTVEITQALCKGAFEKLTMEGDEKTHNEMVIRVIRDLAHDVDVVVCAQGSMHAILPQLGKTHVPVLTSPPFGSKHAVEVLASNPGS